MGIIYINQAIRINFNIGIDTNETSDIILKYKKPDGTIGSFDNVQIENASNGDCYVEVVNDVLSPKGHWTFWSYVTTIDGNKFPGDPFIELVKPEGVSITNKAFIKSYLGITDDSNDEKIDALIPLMEQIYLTIRNAPFDIKLNLETGEYETVYPIGSNVIIAEMIDYKLKHSSYDNVTTERTMSYSYTTDGKMTMGFPNSITDKIKRFVRGV